MNKTEDLYKELSKQESMEWFEKCYTIYPKSRRDRTRAEKSWAKKRPAKYTDEELYNRILAWNIYYGKVGKEEKYIPMMSTWLNSKYKDDIPSVQEAVYTKIEATTNRCRTPSCKTVVANRGTFCRQCEKTKNAGRTQKAVDYCVQKGLIVKGKTTSSQLRENCISFIKQYSEKIGK